MNLVTGATDNRNRFFGGHLLLVLSVLFVWINLSAAEATKKRLEANHHLSFEELAKFVDENKVTTLDELMQELPGEILANPLLSYDSRALNTHLISFKTPRIVLFNKDASLVLALTANPGSEAIRDGLDKLEVISFNRNTAKFEFRDIPFDGKEKPFARATEVNPPVCLACHGQNPRPLFEDYNAWPGFFGSFSQEGYAAKDTPEYDGLQLFLKNYAQLPRYKHLDLSRVREDNKGIRIPSTGFGGLYDSARFTPALAFGTSLEFLMWQRLGKKLDSHPNIDKHLGLIAGIALADQCGGHRRFVKDLYQKWVQDPVAADRGSRIGSEVAWQVRKEMADKIGRFSLYNTPSLELDSRGFMTLPFGTFFPSTPAARSRVDREFFENQFVIFEAFAKNYEIVSEDVSTARDGKVAGVFHIRKLTLLPDEQMFEGLYSGMIAAGSKRFSKLQSMSCQDRALVAENELITLEVPDPNSGGLFY